MSLRFRYYAETTQRIKVHVRRLKAPGKNKLQWQTRWRKQHETTPVFCDSQQQTVKIDVKMVEIMQNLWDHGIQTRACCQGTLCMVRDDRNDAYMQFESFEDLLKFLALVRDLKGPREIFDMPLNVDPFFRSSVRFPAKWLKTLKRALLRKGYYEKNPSHKFLALDSAMYLLDDAATKDDRTSML